jgi:hypothetical protein
MTMNPPRIRQALRYRLDVRGRHGRTTAKGKNMTAIHIMKKVVGTALLSGSVALAGLGLASGTASAFNPQPDPPGQPGAVAVNPQPDSPGNRVAFNPQPEPPVRPQIAVRGGGA